MGRSSFIFNFKERILSRAPKAFILFLVFVIITECAIVGFGPSMAEYSADGGVLQNNARIVRGVGLDKDILIFGDSSAMAAIDAKRLQEYTGLTSLHLAATRVVSIAGSYFLLKEYLKSNSAPKFIILMNTYTGWRFGVDGGVDFSQLANNFLMEMIGTLGNTELIDGNYKLLFMGVVPYLLLPSLRYRFSIERILNKVANAPLTEFLGSHRNIGKQFSLAEVQEAELLSAKAFVAENKFYVSKWNSYYLEKFIQEAAKEETIVFICFPPVHKELYEGEAFNGYLRSCKSFIENVAYSHDNVILLTKDFYVVTGDQITNSDNHLNAEESAVFTDMIAKDILRFMESNEK